MNRFLKHLAGRHPAICGESDIAEFLTNLALGGNYYGEYSESSFISIIVLLRKSSWPRLAFINSVRAKSSEYRIGYDQGGDRRAVPHFSGASRLMFLLMFGGGLRHKECRTLRIKDYLYRTT